ncbi:hypothetical protein F5Y15DRAFT_60967 [Xylariaceae sp. FL0016]|nr:hypothetical protein F5Y15DRAFT_60967 [Xylariaceae sp. FL0016]
MGRAEAHFGQLLNAARFKVVKVWSVNAKTGGLVEAALKNKGLEALQFTTIKVISRRSGSYLNNSLGAIEAADF